MVPEGVELGRKFSFAYGGVLYKVRAAVEARQTTRLSALMFADEGSGSAAAVEVAAAATAGGESTEAGAGAGAV